MGTLAIIQARTSSTRLPRKVLLPLEDKTVIEHVIERVSMAKLIDEIVVATTIEREDINIVKLVSSLGYRVFAGSKDDVLDRFFQVAKLIKPTNIVRITSDCPLIDPKIIDLVIETHLRENADYTSNTLVETFPDGLDVEVFTFKVLYEAWRNAKLLSEREHVTPYIRNSKRFKKRNVRYHKDLSNYRWTIDYPEDYEFLKIVFSNVYKANKYFTMEDVLAFIERQPQILKINSHIRRNEGYFKSLEKDREVDCEETRLDICEI
jgi:spore coat polysaccharide biosynthesis protein SpsF (cytidylyltransferase family)